MKFFFFVITLMIVSGCQTVKVKSEDYKYKGNTVRLKAYSNELRSYAYVPMMNTREIKVSVYSDKDECPDLNRSDSGYLYGQIFTKELSSKYLDIPLDGNAYLKIENVWSSGGNSTTCFQALSFKPERGKEYEISMPVQAMGFKNKCPVSIVAIDGDKKVKPLGIRNLKMKNVFGGVSVLDGQCSNSKEI